MTVRSQRLTMVCSCGDERLAAANAWRQTIRDHISDGQPWYDTWEMDTLIIHALNEEAMVSIVDIAADQWLGVHAKEYKPEEIADRARTWHVQADRFLDALCAIYAAVCMGWDGQGEPWLDKKETADDVS